MTVRELAQPKTSDSATPSPVFSRKPLDKSFYRGPALEGGDPANLRFGHNFGEIQVVGPCFKHTCPPGFQAKLKIGQPGDKYEQEADRVAEQVMRIPEPQVQRKGCLSCTGKDEDEEIRATPIADQITPLVQRQGRMPEEEKEEEEIVQARRDTGQSGRVTSEFASSVQSSRRGGQPLTRSARDYFEPRFGQDFSRVRVHTDTNAAKSAGTLNARAYTIGHDIVFGGEHYAFNSASGKKLMAHELTHVLQQTGGPGRPGTSDTVSHPQDRSEKQADAVSSLIVKGIRLPPDWRAVADARIKRETWYRGGAEGVGSASHGAVIHDLGDGMYMTDSPEVAQRYAQLRAGETPSTARAWSANVDRSSLGRVLDLTTDSRWQAHMERVVSEGTKMKDLLKFPGKNYWHIFEGFLKEHGLKLSDYDAIIGPEAQRGGKQICIRNPEIAAKVKSGFKPMAVEPLRAAEPAKPGATAEEVGKPGAKGAAAGEAGQGPSLYKVGARYKILSSMKGAGGTIVSELEVVFKEGLDAVNKATSKGGKPVPARMVIRITQSAKGVLLGAEAVEGPAVLAETLARQALETLPKSSGGGPAGGTAAGAAKAVSPWVRGIAWGGLALFAVVTGYQFATAPPKEKPRVAVTAAAGFAGAAGGTYLVCNLILGIETLGWSLLICALPAGGLSGYAASEIAGAVYDEATATPVEKELHRMQSQPVNAQRLFFAMVAMRAGNEGVAVTGDFIRDFYTAVPSDLTEQELLTLISQLRQVGPNATLATVLHYLIAAIEGLPGRGPHPVPDIGPIYTIPGAIPGVRDRIRYDLTGSDRVLIFPEPKEPRPGEPEPKGVRTQPIIEIQF